jgi:hypothetical protein
MDLQAAANGDNIGGNDSATAVLRRDHQALRKAFLQYRELMNTSAPQRAGVAQDICMQLEMHFAITREVFYPAMESVAAPLVGESLQAHEDILECVENLRAAPSGEDAELDSTMVRLMELADVFFCKERKLIEAAEQGAAETLGDLGKRMLERRENIAGAVRDLESRS